MTPCSSSTGLNTSCSNQSTKLKKRKLLQKYGMSEQEIKRLEELIAYQNPFDKKEQSLEELVLGFVVEKTSIDSKEIDVSEILAKEYVGGGRMSI